MNSRVELKAGHNVKSIKVEMDMFPLIIHKLDKVNINTA